MTDRPIAIDSLATQLAEIFHTGSTNPKIVYGTFGEPPYLHRSLLWHRTTEASLKPITFLDVTRQPPSWSWMAYEGSIKFLGEEKPEWDTGLKLEVDTCHLKARVAKLRVDSGREDWFDTDATGHSGEVRCAIIGRSEMESEQKYFVLLVAQNQSADGQSNWKRVGLGQVPQRAMDFEGCEVLELG